MRILVPGGAGFVGSHTCLALLEKGYEITVIDSYVNSHKNSLKRVLDIVEKNNRVKNISIDIEIADIRDEKSLEKLFLRYKDLGNPIEAVIHFAGRKSVKESVLDPLLYWDVNVNGSINLLRVMDKHNCRTIVFSSSATIYGFSNSLPLKENSEIKPINPYGRTKVAIEQILNDIYNNQADKWKIANLRYFNPIGAHSTGMIGEAPIGMPNNIFPYITQVAAGILDELTIFGQDWPTLDGTCVRDYIHVMDLAEGHRAALECLLAEAPQLLTLNLGSGVGASVLEVIKAFEKASGRHIPYQVVGRRPGDAAITVADPELAKNRLGWRTQRTLVDICRDGWAWQSANPSGYAG